MSARLHAAKFPVPAQTPSSLAQGAAMQCCRRSERFLCNGFTLSRVCLQSSNFTVCGMGGDPSMSRGHLCLPVEPWDGPESAAAHLLPHSLPFLWKADMLPTQHNCSPGLTQQNQNWRHIAEALLSNSLEIKLLDQIHLTFKRKSYSLILRFIKGVLGGRPVLEMLFHKEYNMKGGIRLE